MSWPNINRNGAAGRERSGGAQMVEALKTVVDQGRHRGEGGAENYTVAGKTGTAQKAERRRRLRAGQIYFVLHRLFPGGQSGVVHFHGAG